MTLDEILQRVKGAKQTAAGWISLCPAHHDTNPSLVICQGRQGILLHCHAGCRLEAICAALGIETKDLFNDRPTRPMKSELVAVYDYRDADGTLCYQVCRFSPKSFRQRRPDPDRQGEWIWNLKGVQPLPYRLPELVDGIKAGRPVFIVEGERDADTMISAGFVATTASGGAGRWNDSFAGYFKGAEVVILPDKDKAGREHGHNVAQSLDGVAGSVKVVEVPDVNDRPTKDISDYFAAGGQAADLDEVIRVAPAWRPQTAAAQADRPRVAKLPAPERPIMFVEWQEVIATNFPHLLRPAETCLSVVAQILLNDVANPFALALVDVPSSGKTITLNFFRMPELFYPTDSFSPAAFVSHASNVKREDLDKVDLLPRIRFKTLVVRDLAPIFGAKEDDLVKTMGILTRALDGEGLEIDSGVHGQRGYRGDYLFMMLAGTTPIPPRVFKIMGGLGSRLFFLALRSPEKTEADLVRQNRGSSRQQKEGECRVATTNLLRQMWNAHPQGIDWNKEADPEEHLAVIARCAMLLANLRGVLNVWKSDGDGEISHSIPVIENPDRINCLLYNLARGHAVVCGRSQIEEADLAPVLNVTLDSGPTIRARLFRGLLEHGGSMLTSQVESLLRCTEPTARKEMETLVVLGLVHKTTSQSGQHLISLADRYSWFLTPKFRMLLDGQPTLQGGDVFTEPR